VFTVKAQLHRASSPRSPNNSEKPQLPHL